MKKALIAGAASAVLAAMPVLGVFADTPTNPAAVTVTDNLTLNINESCTFDTTGGAGLNLSDTINAGGTTTWNSSSHSFTIKCNSKAYTVTAVATDLTNTAATAHGTISYVANADYDEHVASIGNDGEWTAVLTGGTGSGAISKSSSTIKSGNSTSTDTFSVAYKAFAGTAQNQGAYTGTVVYTLQGTNS